MGRERGWAVDQRNEWGQNTMACLGILRGICEGKMRFNVVGGVGDSVRSDELEAKEFKSNSSPTFE
jgi:hypothetical protein